MYHDHFKNGLNAMNTHTSCSLTGARGNVQLQSEVVVENREFNVTHRQCHCPGSSDQVPCWSTSLFCVRQIYGLLQQTASAMSDATTKQTKLSNLHNLIIITKRADYSK